MGFHRYCLCGCGLGVLVGNPHTQCKFVYVFHYKMFVAFLYIISIEIGILCCIRVAILSCGLSSHPDLATRLCLAVQERFGNESEQYFLFSE